MVKINYRFFLHYTTYNMNDIRYSRCSNTYNQQHIRLLIILLSLVLFIMLLYVFYYMHYVYNYIKFNDTHNDLKIDYLR